MTNRESILSFTYADDEAVELVDRSRLERYSVCPAQARLIDSGAVLDSSLIAEAGNAVHEAFSQAVSRYLSDPTEHYSALVDEAMGWLRAARPDIQPDALAAGRPAVWAWAKFISQHSAKNVLRYDGGEGERSGQLAADLPCGDVTLRITSELDLLLATPAKQVLREVDYKGGWKRYGTDSIAASFQFGLHAWLLFQNYPEIEAVEVQVWQTRSNSLTYPVCFDRSRLPDLDARIRSAAGEYVRYRNRTPQDVPTWPDPSKCSICPAAALCPASHQVWEVANDPMDALDWLVATTARMEACEKLLSAHVEKLGHDLVSPSGAAFGTGRVKRAVKPKKELYTTQPKGDEPDERQD